MTDDQSDLNNIITWQYNNNVLICLAQTISQIFVPMRDRLLQYLEELPEPKFKNEKYASDSIIHSDYPAHEPLKMGNTRAYIAPPKTHTSSAKHDNIRALALSLSLSLSLFLLLFFLFLLNSNYHVVIQHDLVMTPL